MPGKNYIVELTSEERNQLKRLINTGKVAAYKQRHARILLLADEGSEGPKMTDDEVAKAVGKKLPYCLDKLKLMMNFL